MVFEDSASGVAAGKAAGCTVIATPFTHEAEGLEGADYIVEGLTGVQLVSFGDRLEITFQRR